MDLFEMEMAAAKVPQLQAENARLMEENEAYARNLRGNHAITGATYEHLIQERDRLRVELAAAQATIARMREALEYLSGHVDPHVKFIAEGTLSIQCNQDALHEARALECERLKNRYRENSPCSWWLDEEAAAHRARKENSHE